MRRGTGGRGETGSDRRGCSTGVGPKVSGALFNDIVTNNYYSGPEDDFGTTPPRVSLYPALPYELPTRHYSQPRRSDPLPSHSGARVSAAGQWAGSTSRRPGTCP